jgi:adenosyl cobinamide kinase/adenosyl cobinamide phosphate guanylyltransferase
MKTLILGGVRSGKSRHAEDLARARKGRVTVIATGTAQDDEMAARIEAHRRNRPPGWRVIEEPIRLAAAIDAAAIDTSALDTSALDTSALDTSALNASALGASALDASALNASALGASALDAAAFKTAPLGASALDSAAPGPVARPAGTVIIDCLTLWLTNLLCGEDAGALRRETDLLLEILPRLTGECIFVSNEVGLGIMPMNALARRFGDEAGLLHQRLAALCDRVVLMTAGLALCVKDIAEPDRRHSLTPR